MSTFLLIISILVAIPVSVFSLEILLSLMPRRVIAKGAIEVPTLTVLIPAHNESGTIQKTLANIKEQLSDKDQVLVVADNCSDDTASIARNYGVEVIERTHAVNRGKGFALDFGIKHLAATPPEVVIIVDADCLVEEDALQQLARSAIRHNRPVQALYLMRYIHPGLKQRISEFAWLVKNHVRPLGLFNIGLPCQLMGTGMAFPWPIISNVSLATSNIVEDMKMGLDMAIAGHAPLFLPDAHVRSTFPESGSAEEGQKKRWEHGHLNMMISVLPKTFGQAIIKASINLLAMTLDLIVPPLALLTLITSLLFLATLITSTTYSMSAAFILSAALMAMLAFSTFIAWFRYGRAVVSFTDLLMIPFYIIGKIPLYISAIFKRQKDWVRTDRD